MKKIVKYFEEVETRVLFVDDNLDSLEHTSTFLKMLNLNLVTTSSAKEALKLFKNGNFDILITSIDMADLNGFKLAKKIKKLNNKVMVILISALNKSSYLKKAIEIGVDYFIPKPMNIDLVSSALKKYIEIDKVNRELVRKNRYFEIVYENYLISKTDTEGIITDVNELFCQVMGYRREELIGKTHAIIKSPKTRPFMFEKLWKTITSGKIFKDVLIDRKKSGEEIILNVIVAPIFDKNGKIVEYLAIRQDVTQEEFLREKLIEEEHKKRMEEQERQLREEFLTIFTHELKTPLNAIINFNQYVQENLFKENKKELLLELTSHIDENANLLLKQVQDMLMIQKLKSDKLELNMERFNLRDLLYGFKSKFGKLNIIFETVEDVIVESDKLRLEEIILNILSNAEKYANGEVYINLKTKNGKWQIQIDDNGKGIKEKKHIFDLYYQEDKDVLKREKKGTGIGLYSVKKLSDKLGIQLHLKDGRVGGALFILQGDVAK